MRPTETTPKTGYGKRPKPNTKAYLTAKEARLAAFAFAYVCCGDSIEAYKVVWPGGDDYTAERESTRMLGLPHPKTGNPQAGYPLVRGYVHQARAWRRSNVDTLDLNTPEIDAILMAQAVATLTDHGRSSQERAEAFKLINRLQERTAGASGPISHDSLLSEVRGIPGDEAQDKAGQ